MRASDEILRDIAAATAEYHVATEGALLSRAGRERLYRSIFDCTYSALTLLAGRLTPAVPKPSNN